MIGTLNLFLAGASALALIILIAVFFRSCFPVRKPQFPMATGISSETFQSGITRIHHASTLTLSSPFNWSDHPLLIADAVENGWSRFSFTTLVLSSSTRSALLNFCITGDDVEEVEFGWEVSHESSNLLQVVRLNPGRTSPANPSSVSGLSVIRAALPLPGPPIPPFPREAYFEIKVIFAGEDVTTEVEGEKTKLVQEVEKVEEGTILLSVGLAGGGSLPVKLPGSYRGSIGFSSTGSVYHDGSRVFESEEDLLQVDRVVGCGFNPLQKRVFFTIDGDLKRTILCKSIEFESPLFPVLAANVHVRVLVNFGQSSFKYAPANAHRTSNPCFVNSSMCTPLHYEDSRELFSIEGLDPQSRSRLATNRTNRENSSTSRAVDSEQESESDLFEIILETPSRKPNYP